VCASVILLCLVSVAVLVVKSEGAGLGKRVVDFVADQLGSRETRIMAKNWRDISGIWERGKFPLSDLEPLLLVLREYFLLLNTVDCPYS